jgi:16S rRNA processing protein RimM
LRKENCFLLGHISRKHGYKGEVIAVFDTDRASDYENLESVFLEVQGELVPFFIEALARNSKGHFIIQFEEIEDGEQAEKLLGRELYLPEQVLPPLSGKKFYFHEVEGFSMIDTRLGNIGLCKGVLERSSQPIFIIDHPSGKEVLIPAVDEFILEIKRSEKQILLDCPEGLVEVYTDA